MMTTLGRSAAIALLFCVMIDAAFAQPTTDRSPTLFTIGDRPVPTDEFLYLYRKNHQHKPEEFTEEKVEEYLQLFINYKLKVAEALSRGMDTTAAFRTEYQTYRDELLKPYLPDAHVIDSMVRLTYDRLKSEVNASHILISLEPDASPADTLEAYRKIVALRGRVLEGEDFGALAAEVSDEPGAATTRGNLGFFTAMQMVFPFEQAAYRTPIGEVSAPVRTRFGYHIVKVHGRQPSRGEVEVAHIMIRTGDGIDGDDARNTIFDIYDKLRQGMPWEELCQQYSEDPNSKDRGGKLRPFGVGGMAAVPEFQEMAFSLQEVGQVSDPVQTRFGWHILRLEAKIPLPSFEELKASLTQRVSRDERVKFSMQALRRRMRAELGYVENAAVKAQLSAAGDSIHAGNVPADLKDQIVFTMKGRDYKVGEFLKFAAERKNSSAGNADPVFVQYVDAVQLQLLEEKVSRESPDYKWLLKEYYEGILLFEIMEKEVWNRAMEDTTGQRRYFEAHRQQYHAGDRMVGKIYSSPSKDYLWQLKALAEQGDTTLQAFVANHRIREDAGTFEKADRPLLSEIPWSPGAHFAEIKGTPYLVVIDRLLPPGPETFGEARASVISDYQTWLEQSWITELKRKFAVKVEKRAKKQAFRELLGK